LRGAALAIRFAVELCLLAAVGYWGATLEAATPARVLVAVAAPVSVAVVWGLFVSPKARVQLGRTAWVAVQVVLFGLGVAALVSAGAPGLAIALGVVALGDLAVLLALGAPPVA
jgi:hypothetical protein